MEIPGFKTWNVFLRLKTFHRKTETICCFLNCFYENMGYNHSETYKGKQLLHTLSPLVISDRESSEILQLIPCSNSLHASSDHISGELLS